MSNVIQIIPQNGEPRVDSRLIAKHLDVGHRFTFRLIRRYEADFMELGVMRFENAKPPTGSYGGRPERFALLNEDQCYLLLTFSRNTKHVRALKVDLVKAFGEARRAGIVQSLSTWNAAWLEYRADKNHITHCARDMRRWRDKKPGHLARLERLHPQLCLALVA